MNYLRRKRTIMLRCNTKRIKTVSGLSPLTATKCSDDNLLNYKIYGKCIQDGIPTPDNPVEIQCVGDKTNNLFNKNESLNSSTAVCMPIDTGIKIINNYATNVIDMSKVCKPNTTYYIHCQKSYSKAQQDSTGNIVNLNSLGALLPWHLTDATFTTGDTVSGKIYFYGFNGEGTVEFKNLYIGTVPYTEYEPYGYKIPVTIKGINLFDKDNVELTQGYYLRDDGSLYHNDNYSYTDYIPVSGRIFTIYPTAGTQPAICLYDSEKNFITGENSNGRTSITVTSNTDVSFVRFSKRVTINDIMLVEGDYTTKELPDYQPYHEPVTTNIYLNKQLYGIDDSDIVEINYANRRATMTRNIYKATINGRYDIGSVYRIMTNTIRVSLGTNYTAAHKLLAKCLSDSLPFQQHWTIDKETVFMHNSNNHLPYISLNKIRFGYEEGDSNDTIRAKIKSYLQAHPITLYYQVATPVVTDITDQINWNDMPRLYEGTNIITVDTQVSPSNTEVTYYTK